MDARLHLPTVIGHRGAAARAPENTLAGLSAAAALGVTWVEVDARLVADGHLVLFHDETLKRVAGRRARVIDTPFSEITGLDAGAGFSPEFAGEGIPTLEEALALIARLGLGVNIELKRCPGAEARLVKGVAAAVAGTWPGDRPPPLLSSFDVATLAVARDGAPHLPRGLIVDRLPRDWRRLAQDLGCVSVHCSQGRLKRSQVESIKAEGFLVGAYVVDDAERAHQLWDWGVDAIFSDAPDVMLAAWDARVQPP